MRNLSKFLLTLLTLAAMSASGAVIHRYSFNDPGPSTVQDSVGTAHGTLRVKGTGTATLDGSQVNLGTDGTPENGGYVDLPNGLVSGLTNITIEGWVTWTAGGTWARIFDFGTNSVGEDTTGSLTMGDGGNYLFLTPQAGGTLLPRFTASDTLPGFNNETPVLNSPTIFPSGVETHFAVTYGPSGARLFIGGQEVASGVVTIPLSSIRDVNVWLGRANWNDPFLGGSYNEFRIHNSLLTLQELNASAFLGGPDTMNYNPGAVTSVSLVLQNSMVVGATQNAVINAGFANLGGLQLSGADVTLTSSATNVIRITPGGQLVALAPGTATITAAVGGMSNSVPVTVATGVATLEHRYSFNETAGATTVTDSVGGMHGTVFAGPTGTNITFGTGQADFPGASSYTFAPYIDLPDGIISSKTNVTVEVWFTWRAAANNTRIFDFGSSLKGTDPNVAGNGLEYFFLTPRSAANQGVRVAARSDSSAAENPNLVGPQSSQPPLNQEVHVAVVLAPESNFSRIYYNGIPVASGQAPWALALLEDINNWIGISQWNDPIFNGRINEFRIYEGVMNDVDIAMSRKAGPNALAVSPGNLVSIQAQPANLLIGNPLGMQAVLLGNYQNVTNVDITGLSGVTLQSANTNIFTVNALGLLTPRTFGTANLVASYQGMSSTSTVSVLSPVSLQLDLTNTLYAGGIASNAVLRANFGGSVTNINVNAFTNVTFTSANTNIATITAAGAVTPINVGTTTIISTYAGFTNQFTLNVVQPPGSSPATLVHRYSFNGTGTEITDLVGNVNGTLINTTLPGTGSATFANTAIPSNDPNVQWVDFGQTLIPAGVSNVTLEAWFTPGFYAPVGTDQGNWVFNLNDTVEGSATTGQYLFYSPWGAGGGANRQQYRWARAGFNNEVGVNVGANGSGLTNGQHHVAVVIDALNRTFSLFTDGALLGRVSYDATFDLTALTTAWLARSSYPDVGFTGSITEFRVYNGALLQSQIAANIAAGPDTIVSPGASLSINLVGNSVQIRWPVSGSAGAVLQGTTALGTGANWTTNGIPAPTVVNGQNQVTIPASETSMFYRLVR
ncbi:MAG TPA: LamG domain-containing protein [Verrucomicrobiae bacterium]|nr:LamG domain-containing protein [Verrucomicrobiae bacterium]